MPFKLVFLATDILIYCLVAFIIIFVIWAKGKEHLKKPWQKLMHRKFAVIAMTVLAFYIAIGLLDSIHFRLALPTQGNNTKIQYSTNVSSLFEWIISPLGQLDEKSYSKPLSSQLLAREYQVKKDGSHSVYYPKLKHVTHPELEMGISKLAHISLLIGQAIVLSATIWLVIFFIAMLRRNDESGTMLSESNSARPTFLMTVGILLFVTILLILFSQHYHLFGTDKVGQDVFFQALKSIRTGLVLGTVTTLLMLPFAILLGCLAGYFGGLIDDVIQYIYTTLSSIPGVLLIAASILSLQIFISNHPELFSTLAARADARLLALCIILGITSWTSLCRLIRAETLKLREMDFIMAAKALGVHRVRIILRHVLPNVLYIVVITVALDFSGLVLAEAVLTYVGVGVDPTMSSWGNMINSARLELARDPVIWWPLLSAFVLMFILVLCANLFADAIRDAFDPRHSSNL